MLKFKADFIYKNKISVTRLIKALNGNPYVTGLTLNGHGDDFVLSVTFSKEIIRDLVADEYQGIVKKD